MDHTTRDHTNKALHTFGLLGGPIVSNNYTDIIDLESQLKGIKKNKIDKTSIKYLNQFQLINFKETIV